MKTKTANNICSAAVVVAVFFAVYLHDSVPLAVVSIPLLAIALLTTGLVDHDKS